MKKLFFLAAAIALLSTSCNSGSNNSKEEVDTGAVKVSQADTSANKNSMDADPADTAVAGKVKVIRDNFNRINSITKWSSVLTKELNETTEGGEATGYINLDGLEKISTKNYGETFQVVTEYYLLNHQLSFVYSKLLRYNRPIYYDSAAMKENNDSEMFDLDKSAVFETRSYFDKQKMIHQAAKYATPIAEHDAAGNTEKAILEDYNKLRKLFK